MAMEELATNVEKFVDKCTLLGFAKPHPADVARLKKAGVELHASVLAAEKPAKKDADEEKPAEDVEPEVLSQEVPVEASSQEVLSQADGEQKRRRRKKHHHHEEGNE